MCAWQEFKYRVLLLRTADCGKNSSTLHQSVAPENEPAHKWTAFCISRSLLHSRIHVNRYMHNILFWSDEHLINNVSLTEGIPV
jgi:hypothetical protein